MNKGPNCPRTRSAAPQCGQRLMSMSKTRRSRCAQVIGARVGTSSGSLPALSGAVAGPGTPVERVAPVFALDQVPAVSQPEDGAAVTAVPNEFPQLAVGDEAVCEAMIAD